ncbi:MAG: hypothetical protein GEU73_14440 [Chloroflexi bacterium]|nr:hypothetical protein [Chloroflexota bacterium]
MELGEEQAFVEVTPDQEVIVHLVERALRVRSKQGVAELSLAHPEKVTVTSSPPANAGDNSTLRIHCKLEDRTSVVWEMGATSQEVDGLLDQLRSIGVA